MKIYSIVRIGNEYVVQADDKSVLRVASRRKAARLVTDASGLMDSLPAAPAQIQAQVEPQITLPSPSVVPDLPKT